MHPARRRRLAAAALAAALAAATLILGMFTAPPPALPKLTAFTQAITPPAIVTRPAAAARGYTVRAGDTLSAIAARHCGRVNDWTGIWHANRQVIGPDPNRIEIGQRLALACYDPPALLAFAARRPARDGDGDRDGDRTDHPATRASAPAMTGASHYSYAGLEALWISAGGPAWAAAHAASIAECESGGNVYAHNPSGASGLWQILGQVVGGNIYNPYVNARNAVAKFKASGDTFAQWTCR